MESVPESALSWSAKSWSVMPIDAPMPSWTATIISPLAVLFSCRVTSLMMRTQPLRPSTRATVAMAAPIFLACIVSPLQRRDPRSRAGGHVNPGRRSAAGLLAERLGDNLGRGLLHLREVGGGHERLGIDLVDVLRARRARGEPGVLGLDLEPADRGSVSRRRGERRRYRTAREGRGAHPI